MKRLMFITAVVFGLAVLLTQTAFGYIHFDLDVKRLVDSSDVVCRVGVAPGGVKAATFVDDRVDPPREMPGKITEVIVLSQIKGSVSGDIKIIQPASTTTMSFTGIALGYTYIVFLRGKSLPYEFTDAHNGAIRVPSDTPKYDLGSSPTDKLLAELLNAAKSDDEMMKRIAVEQLGKLRDSRARDLLRQYAKSADVAFRTTALVSRIEIGDAPDPDELLAILQMDVSEFKSPRGYSVYAPQQRDLVAAIDSSVQRFSESEPRKKLIGFDYLSFVTQALECKVIAADGLLRSRLTHALLSLADPQSVPLLAKLLDDPDQSVRYNAAAAFAAIAKSHAMYVQIEVFRANEELYISFWKEWAVDHPEGR